jgi:hypothetical protein
MHGSRPPPPPPPPHPLLLILFLLLLLLLLFLKWHYSPKRTFASLMDLSESALFLNLFPVFNFVALILCTQFNHLFLLNT